MKVKSLVFEYLSKMIFDDEFNVRRTGEEMTAYHNALRIQYHRPDRLEDVLQKEVETLSQIQNQGQEEIDFNQHVIDYLNEAKTMDPQRLENEIAVTAILSSISGYLNHRIQEMGFDVFTNTYRKDIDKIMDMIFEVTDNLANMDVVEFVQGFDLSETAFEKNAFEGYGDEEEEEYTEEELEAIMGKLLNRSNANQHFFEQSPEPESSEDEEELIEDEEEPMDDESQNERVEDFYESFFANIERYKNGVEIPGFFPHHKETKMMVQLIYKDLNALDEEHIEKLAAKFATMTHPDFVFHVSYDLSKNPVAIQVSWDKRTKKAAN